MSRLVYPFHCGSQYADWQEENCLGCSKYNPDWPRRCEIDMALLDASLADGAVSQEIADRMGSTAVKEESPPPLVWACPERQIGEPRGWLSVVGEP